jgi:hypothetical protein
MTRILYWNINNFSINKIYNTSSFAAFVEAQSRLNHILNEVIAPTPPLPPNPPPAPDLIVIAEIYSRTREVSYQGNVNNSGSRVGLAVTLLLDQIRNVLGNTWCLVPPLMLGDFGIRESVAVYYNSATLQFTGPYIWCSTGGLNLARPPSLLNQGNLVNYNTTWRNAMPNPNNPLAVLQLNRTWNPPAGPAMNEWQSAGQWQHFLGNGTRIDFPNAQNRSPFYTRFRDLAGARTLKIFTVHTSPSTAVGATNAIAAITDLALAANEVGVVVGDFNVDTFNMAQNGAYGPLENLGYEMLIDSRDNTNNVNANRRPYCLTHLLPVARATPFNATGVIPDPTHNVYPRFGYLGAMSIHPLQATSSGSIDNAFVDYAGGMAIPAHNTTIVNTIVGKPYNAVAPPPAGVDAALTGGNGYNSSLAAPIPQPAGVNPAAGIGFFRNWNNFQRIASTSDHLAVLFDV